MNVLRVSNKEMEQYVSSSGFLDGSVLTFVNWPEQSHLGHFISQLHTHTRVRKTLFRPWESPSIIVVLGVGGECSEQHRQLPATYRDQQYPTALHWPALTLTTVCLSC